MFNTHIPNSLLILKYFSFNCWMHHNVLFLPLCRSRYLRNEVIGSHLGATGAQELKKGYMLLPTSGVFSFLLTDPCHLYQIGNQRLISIYAKLTICLTVKDAIYNCNHLKHVYTISIWHVKKSILEVIFILLTMKPTSSLCFWHQPESTHFMWMYSDRRLFGFSTEGECNFIGFVFLCMDRY